MNFSIKVNYPSNKNIRCSVGSSCVELRRCRHHPGYGMASEAAMAGSGLSGTSSPLKRTKFLVPPNERQGVFDKRARASGSFLL
jgi:hypothetical protein